MKYKYLLAAFLVAALGQQAQAQTTAWRPFRPGFVYAFAQAASPNTLHTLRVDSAYATVGGDSVYTFNRLMRPLAGNTYQYSKSRNNLLGARLRWQPGTRDFYLEANAEPALGTTQATTLLLCPRAAVGSTWAASTSPALTATLSSRALGTVGAGADSLATITLSNGQTLVVSKRYGLIQGPQWLTLTTSASTWAQTAVPQAGLGMYDPTKLFALNVGDELGYDLIDYAFGSGSMTCSTEYLLRRITSRRLTADSLVIGYTQQSRIITSGAPSCAAAGSYISAVTTGRWQFSLNTGRSPQFSSFTLLTGEYKSGITSNSLWVGRPITTRTLVSGCSSGAQILGFMPLYPSQNQPNSYFSGLDDAAYLNEFASSPGVGMITLGSSINYNHSLTYYRRNGVACGSPANFSTLLPSRAAEAAAAATLHPNPAAEAATLTLVAPTRPGTLLTLTDALGRRVWSREVAAGQTSLPVALAGQPAGLYLVQLAAPGAAPLTWKLHR